MAVTTTFDKARLKLIFDTNTRVAYSAGQWERIQDAKLTHPYVRYITQADERVRASHRPWNNVTLPAEDSFWNTHWPPNGWRCRCRVQSMTRREYDRLKADGAIVTERPPTKTREWTNGRTGEVLDVPVGIDPGWAYNPGQAGARRAELAVWADYFDELDELDDRKRRRDVRKADLQADLKVKAIDPVGYAAAVKAEDEAVRVFERDAVKPARRAADEATALRIWYAERTWGEQVMARVPVPARRPKTP